MELVASPVYYLFTVIFFVIDELHIAVWGIHISKLFIHFSLLIFLLSHCYRYHTLLSNNVKFVYNNVCVHVKPFFLNHTFS